MFDTKAKIAEFLYYWTNMSTSARRIKRPLRKFRSSFKLFTANCQKIWSLYDGWWFYNIFLFVRYYVFLYLKDFWDQWRTVGSLLRDANRSPGKAPQVVLDWTYPYKSVQPCFCLWRTFQSKPKVETILYFRNTLNSGVSLNSLVGVA